MDVKKFVLNALIGLLLPMSCVSMGCAYKMDNNSVRLDSVPPGIAHAEFKSPNFEISAEVDPWAALEHVLKLFPPKG